MNNVMEIADQLKLPNGLRLLAADVLPLDNPHKAEDAREALKEEAEVVLQVWKSASGQYGGRILHGGAEAGRVAGCETADEVEAQAAEAGILFHRVETLDAMPPVL